MTSFSTHLTVSTEAGFNILKMFGPDASQSGIGFRSDGLEVQFGYILPINYRISNMHWDYSQGMPLLQGQLEDIIYNGISLDDNDALLTLSFSPLLDIPQSYFITFGQTEMPGLFDQVNTVDFAAITLSGDDYMSGGSGADTLYGFAGDDVIEAGGGNDYIDAGEDWNEIDAGSGNDTVVLGPVYVGISSVTLGAGHDTLVLHYSPGRSSMGNDMVGLVQDFLPGVLPGSMDRIDVTAFFNEYQLDLLKHADHIQFVAGHNGTASWTDILLRPDVLDSGSLIARLMDVTAADAFKSTFYGGHWLGEWTTPSLVLAAGGSVDENSLAGTRVGRVNLNDAPAGALSYSILEDTSHYFRIEEGTGVIRVASGAQLDYETMASHQLTIRATDANGDDHDQMFTIAVRDLPEQTIAGSIQIGGFKFDVDPNHPGRTLSSAIAGENAIPTGFDVRIGYRADGQTFKIEGTAANPLDLRLSEEAGIEKLWARHVGSADIDFGLASDRREVWVRDTHDATVATGLGDDRIALDSLHMAGRSNVSAGAGNDFVGIRDAHGGMQLRIDLGEGNDRLIIRGTSEDVIDGGAGADIIDAGGGNDTFIMRKGEIANDWIKSFNSSGDGGGDQLRFVDWNAGMTLEHKGGGRYLATDTDGWTETFYLRQFGAALTTSDWHLPN